MKIMLSLSFAWLSLASSACFAGTVLNGSFENDFTDWSTQGIATIETPIFGVAPSPARPFDGVNQALIRSAAGVVGDVAVANLAAFLSIPVSQINANGRDAIRGSGVAQVITNIKVGDTLSFNWNFLTSQTPSALFNDFAILSVSRTGGTQSATLLADTGAIATPFGFTGDFFSRQSRNPDPLVPPLAPTTFTFTEAGDYTIGFGVFNATDSSFPSGLLIDNISLTAVPEPTALAGLGLFGLALTFRRRRK